MSVRATERLIGDIVMVSALPKSPHMVVFSVDTDKKAVFTSWFSNSNEYQEGCFPASALDRVEKEIKKSARPKTQAKSKMPGRPGRPKSKR